MTMPVSFPESQFIHLAMPDCISPSPGDWRARQDAPMCAVCLQATQKAVSLIRACATLNRVNSVAALCMQCDTLQGLLHGQVSIESKGEYGARKVAFIGNQRRRVPCARGRVCRLAVPPLVHFIIGSLAKSVHPHPVAICFVSPISNSRARPSVHQSSQSTTAHCARICR